MTQILWTQDLVHDNGVCERGFAIEREGQVIPGVLWSPVAASGPQPLVLMGHGGSGHKRNERMLMLGHMFAADYGWHAAAIDGPVHGGRGPVNDANHPAYRAMWQQQDVVQGMIEDWRTTLDGLSRLAEVDSTRVGYWGVSMGTMFGVPYVASEHRIRAAVLGKAGMSGTSVVRSGIDRYFETFAAKVIAPVLFVMQWDDERFERSGQLVLFDRLGSPDKRLHAYPGLHIDNGPEAFEVQAAFLERYL
ncbi:MAG: alpha/beta hydrolase [bacterium]|nr:alpha/beta hydrolase [bacterium]